MMADSLSPGIGWSINNICLYFSFHSDKITSAFPGSIDAAVNEYVSFVESCKDIEESECVQLKKYFSDMKVFWYSRLKGHLLRFVQ